MSQIFERVGFAILQYQCLKAFRVIRTFKVKMSNRFYRQHLNIQKNNHLILLNNLELFFKV